MSLGARLGRYRIERLLGKGGMGSVYLARRDDLDEPVVVKVVNPECARDPVAVARLAREAKAASRVDSEHVVRVIESGVENGTPFIAMEYVEGVTLQAKREERGRIPHAEATRMVLEAARGLRAVHAAGILHRDVKPANILVGPDGRAKLADFGICKLTATAAGVTHTGTLSSLGEVVGSPDYMSPEHAQEEPLDARTDLYSLGVTYYELLTGELPFHADSALATLARALNQPVRPPRELVPDLPPEVERACLALMAREKEDRPADTEAAIALLEGLGRRRRSPLLATAALLAAGIVLGVFVGVVAAGRARAEVKRESPVAVARPASSTLALPAQRPNARAVDHAADALARARSVPFAKRDRRELEAVARLAPDSPVAREALAESAYLEVCDAIRRDLVFALAACDVSKLGRGDAFLAPLRSLRGPPPAIQKDLEQLARSFKTSARLAILLARAKGDSSREMDERLARLRTREGDERLALTLHLAAQGSEIPDQLVQLLPEAGPLLAALGLDARPLAAPAPTPTPVPEVFARPQKKPR